MPNFGRLPSPDARDHNYLMRRLLAAPGTRRPTRKTWRIAPRSLDQGDTGTCVGHAWKNFLRCAPIQTTTGPTPFDLYRAAVLIDEWADNDAEATGPDSWLIGGTSVRAGAEAVLAAGRLATYLWAFDVTTTVDWVLTQGPIVLGTNWYDSMMRAEAGMVHIAPGARIVGGHSYLLRGIDLIHGLATCENSWGDGWGSNGAFYLPLTDLERLLHEDGEACTAHEKKVAS